jgi:50S ribosomal protein L16 3-hydroxylase
MQASVLGDLTPAQFMRRHWQKEARLVRRALPGFQGLVSRRELFALAARDDVESRLVVREGRKGWSLEHGPFAPARLRALPPTRWTLLVQGVDLHLDAAARLLERFAFIPYARLDDLMISYAVPDGGVGPHVDSYDVFLLQGPGRRRWRVSRQRDLALKRGVPLKILARFEPDDEWVLDAGDMLYLPPNVAHDGVALTECMTYSIGFRTATANELVEGFLQHLPDAIRVPEWRYADPQRTPTSSPGRIDAGLQRAMASALGAIRWDRPIVDRFIGAWLSEPKANVFFEPPQRPLSRAAFGRRVVAGRTAGVRLDRRSRMLYDAEHVYLNGAIVAALGQHPALAALADRRRLRDAGLPQSTIDILYESYLSGALHVGANDDPADA